MNLRKPIRAITLSILALTASASAMARNEVIEKPQFETRTSSVITPERIELSDTATRIDFHAIFRPHWWIMADSTFSITDCESGAAFTATKAEGIKFGEQFWMPESGEHRFSIFFPPLPDSTKKINIKNDNALTYGVSLDKPAHPTPTESVQAKETAYTPASGGFFTPGITRLHGKILNYDRRTGPNVLLIFIRNLVTGEDLPTTITINDDGTFNREIYLPSPHTTNMKITDGCFLSTYLEKDNDLEIIVDWEDILHIDRMGGLPNIQFGGSLAKINRELYNAPECTYLDIYTMSGKASPEEAKEQIDQNIAKWEKAIDKYKSEASISDKSARILDYGIITHRGYNLLDYDMYRRFIPQSDTINEESLRPLPVEYYRDFMTEIMAQDTALLATPEARILLNRIAYCSLIDRYLKPMEESGSATDRLLKELSSVTDSVIRLTESGSTPLIWQLAMCDRASRPLEEKAKSGDELQTGEMLTALKEGAVADPTLRTILDNYCDSLLSIKPYELPDTEAGRIMRKIIEPHKGKLLIIDFWGTGCGPCRKNIEGSRVFRDKYRGHPDFELIFITGEDESPRASYDKYVAQNLQGETCHYLSASDIARLRELFGISGIPRYILIDRDGKVANNNYNFYSPQDALLKEGIKL